MRNIILSLLVIMLKDKVGGAIMLMKNGLLILAATLLITGCGKEEAEKVAYKRQFSLEDLDKRVVKASNAFGLGLYTDISKNNPDANVFLSPLSVTTALALAYNGASGNTAEAMGSTLGLNGMKLDEVNRGYRVMLELLHRSEDGGTELTIANSLWMREGEPFRDSFVRRSVEDYSAEASEIDFDNPDAAKVMNGWVKKHTNGKIIDMVESIAAESMLYVLNAVYFQGAWLEPFQPEATTQSPFFVSENNTVTVDMMSQGGRYEYVQNSEYEAIRLPFGKDASASMTIFVPVGNNDIGKLQEKFAVNPELVTEKFDFRQGRLELPKVKFEYGATLNDSLRALGMGEALDPLKADFSKMAPEPPNIFISKVEHKTYLEINEQGTFAAAATKVEMMAGGAQPEDPFRMTVNRPFLLSIADRGIGCILFIGTVMNPNG